MVTAATASGIDEWLIRFHRGEHGVLVACYDEHFQSVEGAVGRVLLGVDREAIVQDVFARMFTEPSFREKFSGGSLRAWLCTVGRNRAVDHLRKAGREDLVEPDTLERVGGSYEQEHSFERNEAKVLVDRFVDEVLPEKWRGVFQTRFIEQLSQRDAAKKLGVVRTTLAYQELRIRRELKNFLLQEEPDADVKEEGDA
ncbi:MAG: sigma-70 family RNA polymerase sigma factor [Deltaproteobacteria bacterium]|nr:sigma-70 family RNA polymerase sigma factor [Deltaproteobacteria bacterium]